MLALVFAGSGSAGVPLGNACQAGGGATGGQIAGGGATLQTRAQVAWIQGYTNDVCGFVNSAGPTFTNSPQASSNSMVIYNGINDNSQTINTTNGSGAGLALASCRATPYSGTDTPYTTANLTNLDGNPGAQGGGNLWYGQTGGPTECSDSGTTGLTSWLNPFYGTAGAYPNEGGGVQANADQVANIMSYPVTGTAVAVGVYFAGTSGCPTTPQITDTQISNLFGGITTNWSQLGNGGTTNTNYSGCNLAVTRVVRLDGSGTSQNFKNFLKAINPSGLLCDGTSTWTSVATTNTNNWPTGGSCSTLTPGHISGNPGVLDTCTGSNGQTAVPGAICYADLPDFLATTPTNYQAVAGFDTAQLQAGATGAFVAPFVQHHANCDFSVITTPGPSSDGAVGLAPGDSWATNNAGGVHQNVWNKGTGWPACATTFDVAYTGTSLAAGAAGQPNQSLNNNMRRTLYSYMLYVLNEGQQVTPTIYYQSLPQGLLNLELTGFKANY